MEVNFQCKSLFLRDNSKFNFVYADTNMHLAGFLMLVANQMRGKSMNSY